jgi:precorrin-6B methylase 2
MSLFLDYLRSLPIYRALCAVHDSDEGNTLEIIDDATAEAQIEFHRWALGLAMTSNCGAWLFLEIGHNKGMWALLVSYIRPHCYIDAIDQNPRAADAAKILTEQRNIDVNFFQGKSRDVLENEIVEPFDYAWVDGGHDYDDALSDLTHCDRLKIPFVAVDDTAYESVANAVATWLGKAPYKEIPNPFIAADARQARLYRRHQS